MNGRRLLHETTDLAAVLTLDSIGCRLPPAEIYAKVPFAPANPVEGGPPQ